ncbi:prolyl oligopeptidase family serine peptidase [Micromonospora sp. NPDC002717]|uniref:prolyl oligopeptidase family serine peptidase n=1 Tax=Micromonospora sp. NPDC002717 TaxID=3154424 RepID=UPI00331AF02C
MSERAHVAATWRAVDVDPPAAPPREHLARHHGQTRSDPWQWMEDLFTPEVFAVVQANNAYTAAVLEPLGSAAADAETQIRSWTPQGTRSVSVMKGRWSYYSRAVEGSAAVLRCRCLIDLDSGEAVPQTEQIVLDEAALSAGQSHFALGVYDVSPDDRFLAYAVDLVGDERFCLRFRDVAAGSELPVQVDGVTYGGAWDAAGEHYFHLVTDATGRAFQVWRLTLATGERTLVYEEADESSWLTVDLTRSERYVFIESDSHAGNQIFAIDALAPESEPFLLGPARRAGVHLQADHREGQFWILANSGDETSRLWHCPATATAELTEVVFGDARETKLLTVDAFAGHVVLQTYSPGHRGLRVIGAENVVTDLALPDGTTWVSLNGNPDHHSRRVRFTASSVVCPPITAAYDLHSRSTDILDRVVLPGWDPVRYEQLDLVARSRDGTAVPLTVLRQRRSTGAPPPPGAVLEVYGAYGAVLPLDFDPARLPFLASGGIYAFAHVRGGGEGPPGWHEAGRGEHKAMSVNDYLACAEALVRTCDLPAGRVVASAASAGALVAAAALNTSPESFAGLVLDVPFLDPLGTLLDPEAALTTVDWAEWGNPLADAHAYAAVSAYAPYDNISTRTYPPVLVFAALNDSRVGAHEALKYVSRLRDQAYGGPFLLSTDLSAGHCGSTDRDARKRKAALICAWVLKALARCRDVPS